MKQATINTMKVKMDFLSNKILFREKKNKPRPKMVSVSFVKPLPQKAIEGNRISEAKNNFLFDT